jgi:hypothetical protein
MAYVKKNKPKKVKMPAGKGPDMDMVRANQDIKVPGLPEGYVFGRPTKYRPEYARQLIEHMSKGFSFKSFGAIVTVDGKTLDDWCDKHPDFLLAKNFSKLKERLYWEQMHHKITATNEGNMTGVIWAMKNKFHDDYKERRDDVNLNLNAVTASTVEMKQLVANMTAEQMMAFASALTEQLSLLETPKNDN